MLKIVIFVIIAVLFRPSVAIECLYVDVENSHYGCEVLSNQFNQSKELITGKHSPGKSDADVTALFVNGKNEVEFSPLFCRLFVNLELIHIERLEEARREDFKECRRVRIFKVVGTELFWLPEDVFWDMTELRELKMPSNKLMYLPAELLSKNLKLEKFSASDNKLEVVDLQFSTSLREVDLQGNRCIHRNVPSREVKTIHEFNQILRTNCESSAMKKFREFIAVNANADVVKIAGSAVEFAATIPHSGAFISAERDYRAWFIVFAFFCAFLIVGWAGTAFVMMKRINEITNGDHQYLINMDFNANQESGGEMGRRRGDGDY